MNTGMQRSFIIGDSWLYYKIYTGPKTSDMILTDIIKPIAESLIQENIIDKWFFIRYTDPKHHIRLRFHHRDPRNTEKIIIHLQPYLTKLLNQDLIWKIQVDTYTRELERYGTNTIELTETLFCHDSEAIISFLELIEGNSGEELRWLFGLRMVDVLLSCFQYTLENKLALLERLKTRFGDEFGMNRFLKKQLDNKYRKERNKIEQFLFSQSENIPDYKPIFDILRRYKDMIMPIAEKLLIHKSLNTLQRDLPDLLTSYIHMTINRLFKSKNRVHEMVCYDFLYRYYKSELARNKKKTVENV